ncbi:chemotaxis protein [Bradyrhizobium sp. U87765 SZCCT0131]|uniref:chemotaxis protein n=1 Tax=unclassified Bradyrhizobium TaxID=2631580 RepID=UPI001BACA081|nr:MULTISPECIES: chemotaxis protein [unclassified Bradyrhizobium]MBR1216382.1 chemotaxis protein [Bradyrhizobium sp. U87765 SZCCT0131]MBR1259870.1 chemotaxis protein [Bradyrhizobium sp. U87765 SZCCT0134]MBR1306003.1 chemotaxis protein [Bradyrhizobium sp. U87765 SZCCT0110]MBR1322370.1 chemotaxis protein [Bradyrhizobium sp. U87765 SZCCT0109]MBR1352339.1 chemotaxis protein [Bradyrhizobium sp. U87765 SZCCT0048]
MIRGATIAVVLLALAGAASAEEAGEPYQRIRALHVLQDNIARGNREAHDAQAVLLRQLGEEFLKADPAVWKDGRNARAVVVFLLSGGAPEVATALRAQKVLAVDEALLDGAIAYTDGRLDEARARLGNLKPRDLPPAIAAEIALVQSALAVQGNAATAIDRLDEARLMMPGTLVEEAALRREIFVAGQGSDFDRFEALSQQYLRRFPQSIYSENFRQRLVRAVDRFGFAQQPERFPRLVALLDQLDGSERPALYLRIARAALLNGKVEMADLAAERAMTLTEDGSPGRERARLYRAAARVVTHAHVEALLDLEAIAGDRLSARDAELLKAALAVGRNVRKAGVDRPRVMAARPDGGADSAPGGSRIDFTPSRDAMRRAQALLDDSQRQLKQQEQ